MMASCEVLDGGPETSASFCSKGSHCHLSPALQESAAGNP